MQDFSSIGWVSQQPNQDLCWETPEMKAKTDRCKCLAILKRWNPEPFTIHSFSRYSHYLQGFYTSNSTMNSIKNCINSWHVLASILFNWFTIWVFPKIGVITPKSSILIGFSITNHPFWDTPIFGNTQLVSKHRNSTSKNKPERTGIHSTSKLQASAICNKNQRVPLQLLQGLSQSTMQLCQIFHTWRYVLPVDGILRSECCNMSCNAV